MYVQRSKEIEAQILFRKQKQKTKNLRQRDKHGFKNYTGGKTVLASGSQFNLVFGRFLPFLPNRTDTRLNQSNQLVRSGLIFKTIKISMDGNTGVPPRSSYSGLRTTLTWKKKFIYNNLKFFICLPFKKILGTPLVFFFFFYANKIKFCSIICSTFKRKKKKPKIKF